MSDYRIAQLSTADIQRHRAALIDLLRDAVDGGSSVNFIAPLADDIADGFWSKVVREVENGERVVLVAFDATDTVMGCVQLSLAMQPNGRHRADLQKLLVHSRFRRRGLASALMSAAESAVRDMGRSLIVLDTERGSGAEMLYRKLGYVEVGIIPNFALNFDGSTLIDTVVFYKFV